MLNPQTDQEWVDGFLRSQLTESAIISFQKMLENDTAFALFFEEQKILADGLRLARLSEQVQYFQGLNVLANEEIVVTENIIGEAVRLDKNLEILERFREKGKKIDKVVELPKKRRNWMTIAASILFLLGFSWYLFLFEAKNEYQLLAEKYLAPYPAFGITKGADQDLLKNQKKGIQLYTLTNYQKALPFLKKSFQSTEYNANSLYIGICYLKMNQLDSAYQYLQNTPILIPELTDATRWYLAIYFLKKGMIDKANEELEVLTRSNALEFAQKATTLKQELLTLKK